MQSSTTKKDDIIHNAYEAFYKHGFHATAVDKLLEDSGISKRTLYKYFRSKEDLIVATIAHYQHVTFQKVVEALAKHAKNPKDKILKIFDLKREGLENGF